MIIALGGRWCLILGASSGIGRATALGLADAGVNVVGVHFDTAAAAEHIPSLLNDLRGRGVRAEFFNVNAASAASRAQLRPVLADLTAGEGIHVVMHSLAFGSLLPYLPRTGTDGTITKRQLDMTLDVMAHSLVYWIQDLLDAGLLRRGAKVFAMTSAGSSQALPSYGAVSAAKAALESHVRQLACELASRGISVNALRAGVTMTPALRRIPGHDEFVDHLTMGNPAGRLTTPGDIADAVVLLSSTDSSWLTGNIIGLDGGELIAAGRSWNMNGEYGP